MPNWVTNKVKFKSRGREIIDKIISTNEQEEEYLDFNKIIPRPKTLDITSGGNDKCAMQYALLKMNAPKLKETIEKLKATSTSFYGNYFVKIYNHKKIYFRRIRKGSKRI